MKNKVIALACLLAASASGVSLLDHLIDGPQDKEPKIPAEERAMTVSGAYFSANRLTGELTASGGVTAVDAPYKVRGESVFRTADGHHHFGGDTLLTTCTNAETCLHWKLSGDIDYYDGTSAVIRKGWLYLWDVPVFWLPYWYYPLNTDYGFRFMPGYTTRWGGYLLTGYVYNLVNEGNPDAFSLGGSTYADIRTKNGFAAGQTIRWGLKEFGHGKINFYHAWDEDADRYERQWNSSDYKWRNWGSTVDRDRYRILLEHEADLTERDSLRALASFVSDSWVRRDFFQEEEELESIPINEVAYEHRENDWAAGGSVSGPLNEFYGGTARLPEAWLAVMPQPVWDLPVNYESQTRAGYLNRSPGIYEDADAAFRYLPYLGPDGKAADYQAFRADTFHRLTTPFKLWDVLSVVPRVTYHGTYWSDSGDMRAMRAGESRSADEGLYRNIAEVGFTAAARGSVWMSERWKHTVEPYWDYSYQAAQTSGGKGRRAYIFDSYDGSVDWLDQFGFEGRGLPYSWHGIRPGVRNLFQRTEPSGVLRTIAETDLYLAVPFESFDHYYGADDFWEDYPEDHDDPHYGDRKDVIVGTRLRFNTTRSTSLAARLEYDSHQNEMAYSDVIFKHKVTRDFNWFIGYISRDHRIWDYAPSKKETWNWQHSRYLTVGFSHHVCDAFAWSPRLRYDCSAHEIASVGSAFDFMTDCLGLRVSLDFEDEYKRADGSTSKRDVRGGVYLFLRAFGPDGMLDFGKF